MTKIFRSKFTHNQGVQWIAQSAAPLRSATLLATTDTGVKRQTMITQQVTAIALRIFSIWLLIQLILNLPSLVMLFASVEQYQQQEIPIAAYASLIGVFISIGLIAVFLINKAANSVLNRATSDSEATLSSDSQKVLFQLAGLYFVVNALAYLPRSLAFIPSSMETSSSSILWPAGLVFQLAVGLWLVSASTFWVNLFNKLRGRG